MPKRFISTGELDSHVIVPISKQILHRLISEMGYTDIFKNRLYFQNEFLTDSYHGTDNGTPYLTDNHVQCVINPVLNPTSVKWAPNQSNYRLGAGISPYDFNVNPVFACRNINTVVREALIACTIQLDIKFGLLSRANAYDLLNRIYSKYAPGEMIAVNDFVFEYKVPDDVVSLLFYLYGLAAPSNVNDSNRTDYLNCFMAWMKLYSSNKFSLVFNRNNPDKKEIVVNKNVFHAVSQIDCNMDKPESNKTNQSTLLYEVNLTYTLQFNRPAALMVDFPVICNNQLVEEDYLSLNTLQGNRKYPRHINENVQLYAASQKAEPDMYDATLMLPYYDDWQIPYHAGLYSFKYFPFLVQVFTLDDVDNAEGVTEIDLADGFDVYQLKDHVLKAYEEEGSDALIPWGPYMLQVYANDDLVDTSMLSFEGTKLTIKNRDISKLYHLVLSKREDKHGVNQTKRVWLLDLICEREQCYKANSGIKGSVRRHLPIGGGSHTELVL